LGAAACAKMEADLDTLVKKRSDAVIYWSNKAKRSVTSSYMARKQAKANHKACKSDKAFKTVLIATFAEFGVFN